jgi:hypothetical protein
MATEQMPPELASRDARRRRREFNSLMWLCGWGGVTAIALFAFAIASQTTPPVNGCGASSPPVIRQRSPECPHAWLNSSPRRNF